MSSLARTLGVSTGTVDRLLNTLAAVGYVEQSPMTRRYRLTLKLAALGERVRARLGVIEVAHPHLVALAAELREGVNLGVLVDGALIYADSIPTDHLFRIEARPGTSLPAYCTAAGKVLLAHQPPDALEAILDEITFEQHTDATLADAAALRAELARVRRDGHALDRGELLAEAWCAAAPVFADDGTVACAISATSVQSRFARKHDEIVADVMASARDITADLAASAPHVVDD